MRLRDCDLVAMLPAWMQDGADTAALAAVVDAAAAQAWERARLLSTWDKVGELPEDVLDDLAWALDITWWDSTAPIETKRALVLDSDWVHSKMGTVAAMESVAAAYLGDGEVLEWFDYGGEPHHFKISTASLQNLRDNRERLIGRIQMAKRLSSKLESIIVRLSGDLPLSSGMGVSEGTTLEMTAGREAAWVLGGVGLRDRTRTAVDMTAGN